MPKRRREEVETMEAETSRAPKKHTLDSDEEDSDAEDIPDQQRHLDGEEDSTIAFEGDVAITPFNMKEELEEGHFDAQGHYQWKKEKEIKDGWLDNIDWVKVTGRPEDKYKVHKDDSLKGLGEDSSSDSETEEEKSFDLITSYKEIISFMKEKETILKTIKRLGSNSNISSAERWKRKKAGIVDSGAENVTKLTSIANMILTKTGNMDIYQETYEKISSIIDKANKKSSGNTSKNNDVELDMYADDFDSKEKEKITENVKDTESNDKNDNEDSEDNKESELMWEFKWSQGDDVEVHGPHSTNQMQQWVSEGYFKNGVWVRKCGIEGPFYTSNRIDFELYL